MKRYLFLSLLAVLFIIPTWAQKEGKHLNPEEILKMKIDFISKEIELREDQRAKFVDLYSQMQKERMAAFKKKKEAEKKIRNNPNAPDAEYERVNQASQQLKNIEASYEKKFEAFLSKKQIYQMKEAEKKFRQTMERLYKKNKHSQKEK